MFSKLVLPLLLLAATPVFAGDSSAPPMTRTLAWDMSLDASGKIVSLAAQGKDDEALQAKLEPVIRNWQFDPGRINSEPVATETRLASNLPSRCRMCEPVDRLPQSVDTPDSRRKPCAR